MKRQCLNIFKATYNETKTLYLFFQTSIIGSWLRLCEINILQMRETSPSIPANSSVTKGCGKESQGTPYPFIVLLSLKWEPWRTQNRMKFLQVLKRAKTFKNPSKMILIKCFVLLLSPFTLDGFSWLIRVSSAPDQRVVVMHLRLFGNT